ncbi:uncharacterized protein LOC113493736 [Trichoplusia ni]|uniref:Uncharacterized protein LOC113493736 n=1 Tax=Trichoplusia ni TaxID=7111 RepID=A0A7E5VGT7_TRINI|nr:uncharacterized protein LOC113493736 [Trichoplusia ni]
MARVETYVFLDLETTGLPKYELNKSRITELSMVAVSRDHVVETRPGALPRVISKFTKCFNPQRMIYPIGAEFTGLCNDLLENETAFNKNVFNTINNYLELFRKPICLIAENGHNCDFPILKNHFVKLNCTLPDDVLCADSLYAFYDILKIHESVNRQISDRKVLIRSCNEASISGLAIDKTQNHLDDLAGLTQEFLDDELKIPCSMQEQNEKTPQKKKITKLQERKRKVTRRCFFGDDEKPEKRYKLHCIYERVLRRPAPTAHRAENDSVMTMEIAIALGQRFVDWVDDNHTPFADVKPMRCGVPLEE